MFDKAARLKLRFPSPKGQLTTEDLWDLPLTAMAGRPSLDDTAKTIYKSLNEGEVSFVSESKVDEKGRLCLEIVQHIIRVKQAERAAAADAYERSAKKQRVMEAIARKQDEQLTNASLEELQAIMDAL